MENKGFKRYQSEVTNSSAYYEVNLIKKGGAQGSNYLKGELKDFFNDAIDNILIKNDNLSNLRSKKVKDDVYELKWDFDLGPDLLKLIGEEYNKKNNKFVVIYPNTKDGKPQLNQNMYRLLHEKCIKEGVESGYDWYIKLYDENITNVDLILDVNSNEKRVSLNLGFNTLINEDILNGNKIKPISAKTINKPYNWIFFGAPGTGKSYELNKEKEKVLKNCEDYYERVTFHPDYTYANFVGAYKPVSINENDIAYEFVPGPFMRLLVKALNNPENPYILIIEEINRANVAAVFGDIFQLLDRKKDKENYGDSEYPINVSKEIKSYLEENLNNDCISYDTIIIPSNMYIWATMNSADQGVYMMDTAFKRRWDFKYMSLENKDKSDLEFILNGQRINWDILRTAINNYLLKEERINEDKLLGPFFISPEYLDKKEDLDKKENNNEDSNLEDSEEFIKIFKNKVLMYLFEDILKGRRKNGLFGGISTDKNLLFSELQKGFDECGLGIFNKEITDKLNIGKNQS